MNSYIPLHLRTPSPEILDVAASIVSVGKGNGFKPRLSTITPPHNTLVRVLRNAIANHSPLAFFHVKYDLTIRFVSPTAGVIFRPDNSIAYWCRITGEWRSAARGSIIGIVHKGKHLTGENLPESLVTA